MSNYSISEKLKYIIETYYKNSTKFAQELGINTAQLSRYISQNQLPSTETLLKISKLGFNIDWILNDEGNIFNNNIDYKYDISLLKTIKNVNEFNYTALLNKYIGIENIYELKIYYVFYHIKNEMYKKKFVAFNSKTFQFRKFFIKNVREFIIKDSFLASIVMESQNKYLYAKNLADELFETDNILDINYILFEINEDFQINKFNNIYSNLDK